MEALVYSGITVVLVVIWALLEKIAMTPWDIFRKWERDMSFIAPEEIGVMLAKTSAAITSCEDVFDKAGPQSEAGEEAVEVLQKLRRAYKDLVIRSKS